MFLLCKVNEKQLTNYTSNRHKTFTFVWSLACLFGDPSNVQGNCTLPSCGLVCTNLTNVELF